MFRISTSKTGKTHINWDKVFKNGGERNVVCYHNTRSLLVNRLPSRARIRSTFPTTDNCLDMTAQLGNPRASDRVAPAPWRRGEEFTGLAKIDLSTGEDLHRFIGSRVPATASMLATAGDLLFSGDMGGASGLRRDERQIAVGDRYSAEIFPTSTITYTVNGKQYVAVMTGDAQSGTAGRCNVVETSSRRAATTRSTCSRCRSRGDGFARLLGLGGGGRVGRTPANGAR